MTGHVYEAIKLAVVAMMLPPGGPIVLVALGALLLRGYPRAGRALVIFGTAALWLLSLPVVASTLVTFLGGARPLQFADARKADAIVILGGGVRVRAAEYGGDTLGRLTLERLRYGAHLARLTGLPVLVTGTAPEAGVRAEADLMREALQREFGVQARWVDDRASNTRENAEHAARVLGAEGRKRVVLVMHGFDVRRATRRFEAAGLEPIPAPTQVPHCDEPRVGDFLPSAAALLTSHYATYEVLALLRDSLTEAR